MFLCFLFVSCISFAQPRQDKAFARIEEKRIVILEDVNAYKGWVKANLFPDRDIVLDKVEVVRQKIIGGNDEFFYYVVAISSANHLKSAHWLERKGEELFFLSEAGEQDSHKIIFMNCEGREDCQPNVVYFDGKPFWSCSETLACSPEIMARCKSSKSLVQSSASSDK